MLVEIPLIMFDVYMFCVDLLLCVYCSLHADRCGDVDAPVNILRMHNVAENQCLSPVS